MEARSARIANPLEPLDAKQQGGSMNIIDPENIDFRGSRTEYFEVPSSQTQAMSDRYTGFMVPSSQFNHK